MALREDKQPTIIRRKRRRRSHGNVEHGSWKVAYADFVTAMMAFFLLMWLVNTTNEEDRNRISEYFNPYEVEDATQAVQVETGIIAISDGGKASGEDIQAQDEKDQTPEVATPPEKTASTPFDYWDVVELSREDYQSLLAQARAARDLADQDLGMDVTEDSDFKDLADQLAALKEVSPIFREYADQILVDEVTDGLRIQFVEQNQYSMFGKGSSELTDEARRMMSVFGSVVKDIPNRIAIAGHTDATPFGGETYGNWELSTDRANAARRAVLEAGISGDQIDRVEGKADTEPLLLDAPEDPRNRRITFVILR